MLRQKKACGWGAFGSCWLWLSVVVSGCLVVSLMQRGQGVLDAYGTCGDYQSRSLACARSSTKPSLQFMEASIICRGMSIIVGVWDNIFFVMLV